MAAIRKLSYSPEANQQDMFEMGSLPTEDDYGLEMHPLNGPIHNETGHSNVFNENVPPVMMKPGENLMPSPAAQPPVRRSSSSNGLVGQQRKGSLPSDYIANCNQMSLSDEWSREKVASMAHQARQRLQNPSNSTGNTFKKIGVGFFLHICLPSIHD